MARTFKIYTAGKMSGLTYERQMGWRNKLEGIIRSRTNADICFIHPPLFYSYEEKFHKSEREILEWELSQIKTCDIVVFDLSTVHDSIGTTMELAFAKAANNSGYKNINIVGFGRLNTTHPWIPLCLLRQEESLENLADYICTYLLV